MTTRVSHRSNVEEAIVEADPAARGAANGMPEARRAGVTPRSDAVAARSTAPPEGSAAHALTPLLRALVGTTVPVRFEFWDGSVIGPAECIGTLRIRSVNAVRRILWAPGELGVARAFVTGDLPSTVTSTP